MCECILSNQLQIQKYNTKNLVGVEQQWQIHLKFGRGAILR